MIERIEKLVALAGRASAWLALAIVGLMSVDVVLRYLFSYGTVWAQELEWHLLTPFILFGIAWALQQGEHVRVDVVYTHFSARNKERVNLLSHLLCLGISVAVILLSLKYVQQSFTIDEGSADPGGLPHRWILKSLIPLGFALLALQSGCEIAKSRAKLRDPAL